MATYTTNYHLEKPAQSDLYNIDVFNGNADIIDAALAGKAENQSLAPIESSATASRNYSVGQQFVYNGLLYKATAAIASGGTITPGSNCARTTVAEELSALNDSLVAVEAVTDTVKTPSMLNKLSETVTTSSLGNANLTTLSSDKIIVAFRGPAGYAVAFVGRGGNGTYYVHITDSSGTAQANVSVALDIYYV